jgi:cytochrome P450
MSITSKEEYSCPATSEKKCPFSSAKESKIAHKNYVVSFESSNQKGLFRKLIDDVKEILSRVSPASVKAAWYMGTKNDWSIPFLKAWKSGSFITEFSLPIGTVYVTADPTVMRAILANPRKMSSGLFYDFENKRLFVQGILNDLYPEDIKRLGVEQVVDMLVISAATPHAALLRGPMIKALGPSAISNYSKTLEVIADSILNDLSESERQECDAAQISFEYAVTVISKIFTNYNATRIDYQNLVKSLDAFSKRMARIVSHKKATKEEENEYDFALSVMRKVIENCSVSSYGESLREAGWNDFQIKANLFFLYFAGTETTASTMNYLIWQLGRKENQDLQNEIRNSAEGQKLLMKAIAEALRLHPPAFIEGRQLRENTRMIVKDKEGKTLLKKDLRKGHSMVCLTQAAGLDADLYSEPELFNPYRYKEDDPRIATMSFLPFGSGQHMCPGQHLALGELQALTNRLITNFSLKTLSPEEAEQKGFFTLRARPAKIQLIKI